MCATTTSARATTYDDRSVLSNNFLSFFIHIFVLFFADSELAAQNITSNRNTKKGKH